MSKNAGLEGHRARSHFVSEARRLHELGSVTVRYLSGEQDDFKCTDCEEHKNELILIESTEGWGDFVVAKINLDSVASWQKHYRAFPDFYDSEPE